MIANLSSLKKLCYVAALCTCCHLVSAKHIVGGDLTYRCIPDNDPDNFTIEVTVTMYRDAYQGGDLQRTDFDPNIAIGVFINTEGVPITFGPNSKFVYFDEASSVRLRETYDISPNDSPCFRDRIRISTDAGVYVTTFTLPVSDQSYLIDYQRCCRNEAISNIANPREKGIVISAEVKPESQLSCNNSPEFLSTTDPEKRPNIRICAGIATEINFSAVDTDIDPLTGKADSLVYKLCQPISSGGFGGSAQGPCPIGNPTCSSDCGGVIPLPGRCAPANFLGIITIGATNSIPGMSINLETGIISGTPTTITGIYLIAVCVEEYRDGVLIGEVRRDFQFEVVDCPPTVVDLVDSSIPADQLLEECQMSKDFDSCGKLDVEIRNETDVADLDDIFWEWSIERGPNDTIQNVDDWKPRITFPGIGRYWVQLIVNPGEICADTCEQFVNITAEIAAKFDKPTLDDCSQSVVYLDARESILPEDNFNIRWDFGDGNFLEGDHTLDPSILTPNHEYRSIGIKDVTLTVSKDDCVEDLTEELAFFPILDVDIVPSKYVACAFTEVSFDSLTRIVNDDYSVKWNFGDGGESEELSPTHQYDQPGTWPVTVDIESPAGCMGSFDVADIEVLEGPRADFSAPEFVDDTNVEITFSNQSRSAQLYEWDFGDGTTSSSENPRHTYTQVGRYTATLIAKRSDTGCQDEFQKVIEVSVPSEIEFPNAFTPNDDGDNDVFFGVKLVPNLGSTFKLRIYDRWGEMVFESNEFEEGWNGRKFNSGEVLPVGVYVYKANFTNLLGDEETKQGTFLLFN